jgi:hypothetical protein
MVCELEAPGAAMQHHGLALSKRKKPTIFVRENPDIRSGNII